ncbi:MAG: hypothetical protein OIF51_03025 [Cellvibrionaceae bacterium]|nr:hypothetical protein [Cellvibrionaceae bacterium]
MGIRIRALRMLLSFVIFFVLLIVISSWISHIPLKPMRESLGVTASVMMNIMFAVNVALASLPITWLQVKFCLKPVDMLVYSSLLALYSVIVKVAPITMHECIEIVLLITIPPAIALIAYKIIAVERTT